MKIGILTNEYPPNVYGGAGVHVEYLTRELAGLGHAVHVLSFGDQDEAAGTLRVEGVQPPVELKGQDPRHAKLFATLLQDLAMSAKMSGIDVVHCHTWYTHFAGCLVKQLQSVPLVLTTHSLEPHRPWKVEQLGNGVPRVDLDRADRLPERRRGGGGLAGDEARCARRSTACRTDRIRVIHNGIDLEQYRPTPDPPVLREYGIDPDVALRAVRRTDHPAEGHHPPGQRDPLLPSGRAGRALRRARPTRRRSPRDGRGGGAGARRTARTRSSGSARCCRRTR